MDKGAERKREKGRKEGERKGGREGKGRERKITKNLLMTIGEIWV